MSRRILLAGKALFTVGEAFVFPWATEGATRPPPPGTTSSSFSPARLRSIFYSETDPDVKAAAKAAAIEGEAPRPRGNTPRSSVSEWCTPPHPGEEDVPARGAGHLPQLQGDEPEARGRPDKG